MGLFHALRRRWSQPRDIALAGDGDLPDLPPIGLSYGELNLRVRGAAGLLRAQGVQPGDVVLVQLPRSLAQLELHLGTLALGATCLLLNDRMPGPELDFYLQDSSPRLAILGDPDLARGRPVLPAREVREHLDLCTLPDELPEPPDDARAALMYTSGTTGRPKGAMMSHGNLLATIQALQQAWRWSSRDHLLHTLPLFHVHGLVIAMYGALYAGARTTLAARFEPDAVLASLSRLRATVYMGVPTHYHRFLSLPPAVRPELSAMRLFTSGSAALPAADHAAFQARFGHTILERYGMTEVGIVLSNPYEGPRRPGTVGLPLPGVRARVVDPATDTPCDTDQVGEIQIGGRSVFQGYLGLPEATEQALRGGWMHTGDLGKVDEQGFFHIVGRRKELVIVGGFNVYPLEVEAALRALPGVAEAAVVGLPDPDLGEVVAAAVVPLPGVHLEPQPLLAALRLQLSAYKLPRQLHIMQELPLNAMGKVQKHRLQQQWAPGLAGAAATDSEGGAQG